MGIRLWRGREKVIPPYFSTKISLLSTPTKNGGVLPNDALQMDVFLKNDDF